MHKIKVKNLKQCVMTRILNTEARSFCMANIETLVHSSKNNKIK